MSQRALEAALGRLVCDTVFRRHFRDDAEATIIASGFDLTRLELLCLRQIGFKALEALAVHVNERMRRADLAPERDFEAAIQKRRVL